MPEPLYDNYIKFSRVLAARVRSTYKLSPSQKNVIWNKSETDQTLQNENSQDSWEPYSQ
jgi:hypothetical protein